MHCYDIYITFPKHTISDGFVENIYNTIFRSGFRFKRGSNFHEHMPIEDIIRVNQEKLMSGFRLGVRQNSRHGYIQIIFETNLYREMRAFWCYLDNEVTLTIFFPEDDLLVKNKDYTPIEINGMTIIKLDEYYRDFKVLKDKVSPIFLIARNLWDTGLPTMIESDKGLYYGDEDMIRLDEGGLLCIRPFCILKKHVYEKFRYRLDPVCTVEELPHDGFLVIDESKIQPT